MPNHAGNLSRVTGHLRAAVAKRRGRPPAAPIFATGEPADKVTQGDIPLGLMQTSLRSRLSRMPYGQQIKEERKEIIIGNFSLDGSSHQTEDAAFTPATPHDSHHSRANTD